MIDADDVVRYVGKGTGNRAYSRRGVILKLVNGIPGERAWNVHYKFAADSRPHQVEIVKDELTQVAAYKLEKRLIAEFRREFEGGTLWNLLPGAEGFQGIPREIWRPIAQRVADNKKLTGAEYRAARLAAGTKAATGSGLRAGKQAALTKMIIKAFYTPDDAGLFSWDQLMGQRKYPKPSDRRDDRIDHGRRQAVE